ncbi:MAG: 3,4-dihydroxy-2-butanone-4-phosphate synthase [Anaplasmataceae bacterium]|nr:3,4-dihydroxy-2-butanone-4-phosphate synthase [Anaplasmataceae bacterium]
MLDISNLLKIVKYGKPFLLTDNYNRENECDIVCASQYITPELINFMATHCRGLICLTINNEIYRRLNLTMQHKSNVSELSTNFTTSIDASSGITTGISAYDRAHTIKVAINPNAKPQDIITPGHIFPLVAHEQGLKIRHGHTEASVFIMELANLIPSAVICEIMDIDGTMLRGEKMQDFSKKHNLPITAIDDLLKLT